MTYTKSVSDIYIAAQRVSLLGQLVIDPTLPVPAIFNAGHIFVPADGAMVALVDTAPPAQVVINGLLTDTLASYMTTTNPVTP